MNISNKLSMIPKQPNILFIFPDQHRPDWLGSNPDLPLQTPNLNRLAGEGVQFTRAYTPSPLCSPARACLATGRNYYRCGVKNNWQNTPLSIPTYYTQLREAGYEVFTVGKSDLHKPDLDWGLDGANKLLDYGFSGGIDNEGKGDAIISYLENGKSPKGPYMKFLEDQELAAAHLAMYKPFLNKPGWLKFAAVADLPDEAYCDNWVAANATRFLRELPQDKPWHLIVNFVGPHGPFDVTAAMRARCENKVMTPPIDNADPDVETIKARRQNYAAMIENIDDHIGDMLEIIEQRGELDNTIMVYASDHGEMLGDHGRWGKSTWYNPSTGIPLIISGPGIRQGVRSDALVQLQDLSATFLDFANAAPLPKSDAISLRPVLEGSTDYHRDTIFSGLNNWEMVFDGRYKLITGDKPSPILIDVSEDPHEMRNAADDHPETVDALTKLLTEQRGKLDKFESLAIRAMNLLWDHPLTAKMLRRLR